MHSNSTDSSRSARLARRLLVVVIAITFIVFSGVLGHSFVHFDDNINIYDNPHLKGLDGESLRWMATDMSYARRYMPLGWLSYAVDREFFGLSAKSYHAGNLLLHLTNVALVFFLLKRLLVLGRSQGGSSSADKFSVWCAAVGALLWAINPLRVENVAWASSRIYCVALLLALVWLHAWLKSNDLSLSQGRRRFFYWLSVIAYGASLLTYPLALFAPVLLFALEVFPLRRAGVRPGDWFGGGAWKLWRDKAPFLLLAAAGFALTLWARNSGGQYNKPITLEQFGLLSRAAQAFYVWGYYLWKPWVPFDLAPIYPTLQAFNPQSWPFVISFLFIVGVTLALYRLRNRFKGLWVFWLCHLVMLVPFLGLSEYNHSPADRYAYLHGLLWAGVGAFGLSLALDRQVKPQTIGAVVLAGLSLLGLFAWQQTAIWNNTIVLHRHLLDRMGEHPGRARFDEVLGIHYLRAGLTNEALASFANAISYDQKRVDREVVNEGVLERAYAATADIQSAQGATDLAIGNYRLALTANSRYVPAAVNLGILYGRLNRLREAQRCFEHTLTIEPTDPSAHHNLAVTLKNLGEEEQAQNHFREAKRLADAQ